MTVDWQRWLTRWETQQGAYMPDREARFTVIVDAVAVAAEERGAPPLVVDLGCGPGSLALRLLDRLPDAEVVGVDTDPVLLALGQGAAGGRAGLRFVDADLTAPGWRDRLGLDRPIDAAVSTTALHWLGPAALRRLFTDLAELLRPGGLFLDGDHLHGDADGIAQLGHAVAETHRARHPAPDPESWGDWWEAIGTDPGLAELVAERTGRRHEAPPSGHHGPQLSDAEQQAALREAGFGAAGRIWQYGDDRVLAAVR